MVDKRILLRLVSRYVALISNYKVTYLDCHVKAATGFLIPSLVTDQTQGVQPI